MENEVVKYEGYALRVKNENVIIILNEIDITDIIRLIANWQL